ENVTDVDAAPREADRGEQSVEELPRPPDERPSFAILVGPGGLADDHQLRPRIALSEHHGRTRPGEPAGDAAHGGFAQDLQSGPSTRRDGRRRNGVTGRRNGSRVRRRPDNGHRGGGTGPRGGRLTGHRIGTKGFERARAQQQLALAERLSLAEISNEQLGGIIHRRGAEGGWRSVRRSAARRRLWSAVADPLD